MLERSQQSHCSLVKLAVNLRKVVQGHSRHYCEAKSLIHPESIHGIHLKSRHVVGT